MAERQPDRRFTAAEREWGWYAAPTDGARPPEDEPWESPADGTLIRFMSEDTVDVPLWSDDGLLFGNGDELVREWGVSQQLADEIVAWGRASQGSVTPELDAEAARLVRALRTELRCRFPIVYQP